MQLEEGKKYVLDYHYFATVQHVIDYDFERLVKKVGVSFLPS